MLKVIINMVESLKKEANEELLKQKLSETDPHCIIQSIESLRAETKILFKKLQEEQNA